tara:strand:+ start:390 stop:2129 length:1740 start_codon:yes stop_codon:yes gene_type:complete
MSSILDFIKRFNKFLDLKIKISLCVLIFNLIILSCLEFISLGSIPILIGFLLEPNSISSILNIDINSYLQNINQLHFIVIVVFSLFLLKSSFLAYVNYYELKTIKILRIFITNKLFKIYLNKDYNFFVENNHSVLSRNLITETNNCVSLIQSCVNVLREIFLLLIIFSLIFLYKPFLSILILVILIFFSILFYMSTDKIIKSIATTRIRSLGNLFTLIPQVLNLIKEIKILKKEIFFSNKFFNIKKIYEEQIQIVDFIRRLPKIFFELIAVVLFLFLLIVFQLDDKEQFVKTLPFFSLIVVSTIKLIPSFNTISGSLTHIQSFLNSFNMIDSQISNKKLFEINKNFVPTENENIISIKDLNFRYSKDTQSRFLENINLDIKKGDMVGIVGKSGSGKTTLINLLLGLLKPTEGKITYYSDPKSFSIGHVPQDIVIFDETLQNNIAFGEEEKNIDQKKIYEVIKFSGLQSFFEKNNSNLNMILGEKGINISGGERQRIGIARALYSNPQVVVLDESTSSLDITTEKYIIDELLNIKKKVTVIFISHRLSALRNCDKIILLEDGKIKTSGNLEKIKNLLNYN